MSISGATVCPLCAARPARLLCLDFARQRRYWRCSNCQLSWLDPSQRLAPQGECQQYEMHENDPTDPGYRDFLARLANPLLSALPQASQGLDFGCGPGPGLAQMLEEQGHSMTLYDPFFYPDPSVLSRQYDFVSATEVVEHCFDQAGSLPAWSPCSSPVACWPS